MAEYQQALALQPDNPALKAYVQSQQPVEPEVAAPPPPNTPATALVNSDSNKTHAIFGVFGGPAFWGGIANAEEDEYEGQSFSTGIGAGVYVGCQFDDRFSVSLNVSQYTLPYKEVFDGEVLTEPGVSLSLQEWQLLTVCKYIMGSSGLRPYISVGMGANLTLSVESENGYSDNYATTAPLFQFGAGAIIPLSHEWDAFVEADYNLAFYVYDNEDENYSFFPINLGVQYNLP
jgi:hypothetical protein